MKPIKLTSIIPALLPPGADSDFDTVEHLLELSAEEITLRHRLELKVERALFRAAVVLQAIHDGQDSGSAHQYLDRGWRSEEKVERAWSEIEVALQELRDHQLYRSTHQSFDRYLRERFGSFEQDYSPVMALES